MISDLQEKTAVYIRRLSWKKFEEVNCQATRVNDLSYHLHGQGK